MADKQMKKTPARHKPRVIVEGLAGTEQLVLRVFLPAGQAKAISEWWRLKQRHQDDAATIVRAAARKLAVRSGVIRSTRPARQRHGLLQGNIPAAWKLRLQTLAKARQADQADLLCEVIFDWINPETGNRRRAIGVEQATSPGKVFRGPVDYRSYVGGYSEAYAAGLAVGRPARQQVELGKPAGQRLKDLLAAHKIPHGLFLGALVSDVCDRLEQQVGTARKAGVD